MVTLITDGVIPNTDYKKYIIDTASELSQLETTFGNEAYCIANEITYICNGSGEYVRKKVVGEDALPGVTDADNGKVAGVIDGHWGIYDLDDEYARNDGYYEEMTVGHAEQLLSTVGNTESEPYLFRPTGGSVDVGNRKNIKKIIGVSASFNQVCDPATIVSFTTTSYAPATALPVGTRVISGHKYLFGAVGENYNSITGSAQHPNSIPTQIYTRSNGTNVVIASLYVPEGKSHVVFSAAYTGTSTGATTGEGGLWLYSALQPNDRGTGTAEITHYQLFDLTQIFGSDVADAIAAKESALAGSGISWIRSYGYLTKDFYPYNAGAFISAKPSAHKTIGFNAWDEVWESGGIGDTGANANNPNAIRSKNYIRVIPGEIYNFKKNSGVTMYFRYYDADHNFISKFDAGNKGNFSANSIDSTRTMHSNCYYLRFYVDETSYENDICVNLSHSGYRNGEYERYIERTYPLADTELKGLLKVDESGNLYADGDTYTPDGTVARRYYEVSSADCTVGTYQLSSARWYLVLPEAAPDIVPVASNKVGNIRASKYFTPIKMNVSSGSSYGICHTDTSSVKTRKFIFTIDSNAVTTQAEAATWVANNPFSILYECVESTETGTAYASTMICDDFGTEEFVDERAIPIPVGHETFYQANLRDKLQHLPSLPDQLSNGKYIVSIEGDQMILVQYPVPDPPSDDGVYTLTCNVSSGIKTFSWLSNGG